MKVSHEIAVAVYGQYIGHKFKTEEYGTAVLTEIDACNKDYPLWFGRCAKENKAFTKKEKYYSKGTSLKNAKVILKPLSKITKEDVDKATSIVAKYKYIPNIKSLLDNGTWDWGMLPWVYALALTDFLRSRGYDLPHYLLGGKTLKEAGLAVYKE